MKKTIYPSTHWNLVHAQVDPVSGRCGCRGTVPIRRTSSDTTVGLFFPRCREPKRPRGRWVLSTHLATVKLALARGVEVSQKAYPRSTNQAGKKKGKRPTNATYHPSSSQRPQSNASMLQYLERPHQMIIEDDFPCTTQTRATKQATPLGRHQPYLKRGFRSLLLWRCQLPCYLPFFLLLRADSSLPNFCFFRLAPSFPFS
ncbi:hypothetical protein HDK90DRAFT_493011 [Phyllosticta capitalensis]|uniref:Uncharacterized protein n=1 Tax=Phyllosticta capitalensis TaxID=121624 RepID=A0ABR1YGB1_9PEZI